MEKSIIMMFACIVIFASCIEEAEERRAWGDTPITIEVAAPETQNGSTKSSFTDAELERITDVNIVIYHNGKLIERCSRYFRGGEKMSIDLPGDKDGFNIYILANVGNVTGQVPQEEQKMKDFRHFSSSYNDFRAKGFPMANKFLNFTKGSPTVFSLVRMVGQYSISINTRAKDAEYTIRQVRLKNCALDIYPFSENGTKALIFAEQDSGANENPGDYLSNDDINRLNNGQRVNLHFLENLQGTLLPDNRDPKKKNPVSLGNQSVADRCTYIEIVADIKTPAGSYTGGRYRFYLGANATSNFDIHRNRIYSLDINMAQDMVTEDDWRIEVSPPQIIGKIRTDKNVARVINGVEDMIFIIPESGNHAMLDYTVEYVNEGIINNKTVRSTLPASAVNFAVKEDNVKGVMKKGIHITTNRAISGIQTLSQAQNPCGTVVLAIKSKDKYNGDPLIVKYVQVDVYDKAWPVLFKRNPADKKLYVYIDNPLNLNFKVGVYDSGRQINTPAEIDPNTGRPRPGTGVIENKSGVFYRILSNVEFRDINGEWVCPDDSRRWTDRMQYSSIRPNTRVTVLHEKPDWSIFNLIDDKADAKELEVFIEPAYKFGSLSGGNQMDVFCTDGRTHTLSYITTGNPYIPYPRFMKGFDFMDMSRSKSQLGPRDIPVSIPNAAEKEMVSIVPTKSEGSFSVSQSGVCSAVASGRGHISELKLTGDYLSQKYLFKNCNDNAAIATIPPFYIANGTAIVYKLNIHNSDPVKTGEKNLTLRGFYAELHGPGRDIDSTPAGKHSAEYFTKNQKQIGGNIHRWFHVKGYYYPGTWMSVNGYISWPYGNKTADGVRMPTGISF